MNNTDNEQTVAAQRAFEVAKNQVGEMKTNYFQARLLLKAAKFNFLDKKLSLGKLLKLNTRVVSAETRAKQSAAHKARWVVRKAALLN